MHGWVFFPEQVVELHTHLSVSGEVGEGLCCWHEQLSQDWGSQDEFCLFLDQGEVGHVVDCLSNVALAVWSDQEFSYAVCTLSAFNSNFYLLHTGPCCTPADLAHPSGENKV